MRVAIDPDVTSFAYALEIYRTGATTFELWEVEYGNYFTNNVILRQTIPNYITYAQPASLVFTQTATDQLAWFYQTTANNSTNFTLVYNDNATASNINTASLVLTGTVTLLYQNYQALIVRDSTNAILLYQLNKVNNSYGLNATLTSVLAGFTVNSSSVWGVSSDGARLRLDSNIFVLVNGTFTLVNNTITWVAVDMDLLIVVAANKIVYKLNTTSLAFKNVTNTTVFIPASATVHSVGMGMHFAIVYTNATSVEVQVFGHDSKGNVVAMFNYTVGTFTNAPTVIFSPLLTKLLVHGTATVNGTSTLLINAYSLSYTFLTAEMIRFPMAPQTDSSSLYLTIADNFLYARQLTTASGNPAQ